MVLSIQTNATFHVRRAIIYCGIWLERRNIDMCQHVWINFLYTIISSIMVNEVILILLMRVVL